jgi:glucose-6-phosphate isomerase
MKISNFDFSLESSKPYKNNFAKCSSILNSLLKNKENFFVNTLSEEYQKNLHLKTSLLKKKLRKKILIIGMGGSSLGSQMFSSFFGLDKNYFFLDNLDVDTVKCIAKYDLKDFSIFIISKSGDTLETLVNFNIILKIFKSKINDLYKNFIIISERDSKLHNFALKNNIVFFEHKENLSGRYSVLSETGLSMFNFDYKKIIKGINLVLNKKLKKILVKNAAILLTLIKKSKIDSHVSLIYSQCLLNYAFWHQQLLAESIGKSGNDLTPIISECPKDHHSIMQLYLDGKRNKFFSFLKIVNDKNDYSIKKDYFSNGLQTKTLNRIVDAQFKATINIFKKKLIPFRVILIDYKNPLQNLVSLLTYSMLETAILSKSLGLNPFNQPAVQLIKKETKSILS